MKSRVLIVIGIIAIVTGLGSFLFYSNSIEDVCIEGKNPDGLCKGPTKILVTSNDPIEQLEENKIVPDTSDEDLKSKAYIANCDETLHKKELPDLTIENSTHNYDMQYCKWELKYPDLTLIDNAYLLNDYPYCAELFDTLFDYYQSISDPCGMQRYNEDGTPRGICEPAPAGAGVPYDINMIQSGCAFTYDKWAYLTEHNDDVFYLFGRDVINDKIHGNLDEQIKIIDKLCEDNDYLSVKPNIKFRNNTHWIDTDNCTLKLKNEN